MRKSQNGVMSSAEPSANVAVTFTWSGLESAAMAKSVGVSVSLVIVPLPGVHLAPPRIHSRKTAYTHEPLPNRIPPSWAVAPVALSKSRLSSGLTRLTRRPRLSRVRAAWSKAGS